MRFLKYILWFVLIIFDLQAERKALITGIIGQDGSYLAELLQKKGYLVYGIDKYINQDLLDKYFSKDVVVYQADITDYDAVKNILMSIKPDEIYNLAAQSNVMYSYENPEVTTVVNSLAPLKMLELIKLNDALKKTRFFQASSCEMFGNTSECPQNEKTLLAPQSPYAISKTFTYWLVKMYRDVFGMYACNGILFNHESPRRPPVFVTKKIIKAVVRIKHGLQDVLEIGNLDAQRDWGHARDYVEAMWLMLQQEEPDDYVVATGETHTVREFIEIAFKVVGIDIVWRGKGLDELGIDKATDKVIVKVNKAFFRPLQSGISQGDIAKARKTLGWYPKLSFKDLISEMVQEELKNIKPKL